MYDDYLFMASEIAYVYAKCEDPEQSHIVTVFEDPYKAKSFGKTVLLRSDWEDVKVGVMYDIVRQKFIQNTNLGKRLIQIEEDIVEENYWGDTFWGVCRGIGENHLGNILMLIRSELKGG